MDTPHTYYILLCNPIPIECSGGESNGNNIGTWLWYMVIPPFLRWKDASIVPNSMLWNYVRTQMCALHSVQFKVH